MTANWTRQFQSLQLGGIFNSIWKKSELYTIVWTKVCVIIICRVQIHGKKTPSLGKVFMLSPFFIILLVFLSDVNLHFSLLLSLPFIKFYILKLLTHLLIASHMYSPFSGVTCCLPGSEDDPVCSNSAQCV